MELTIISDTHGKHDSLTGSLTGGDILIHCGDVSGRGYEHEIVMFLKWFSEMSYHKKIFIGGNHDFYLQNNERLVREMIGNHNKRRGSTGEIIFLQDDEYILNGVKFYGTPWQPWFYDWAYNLPRGGEKLKMAYDIIPDDVDVLITHCPPMGILDITGRGDHAGSELLYKRLKDLNPAIHCFGHIHEGCGQVNLDGTQYVNASVLDERYECVNQPVKISL